MIRHARRAAAVAALLLTAACGTTYAVPKASDASTSAAEAMFAEERASVSRANTSPARAAARFRRVTARVKPAATEFCRSQAVDRPDKVCDLPVLVDGDMPVRNAYQSQDPQGRPFIAFTIPMLMDARSDDEVAFVLAHEYGHHIADHIEKQRNQALAGALIMGALTATSQAYATQANPYRYTGNDSVEMQRNMSLGVAVGQRAYSQTYELESDTIATHITLAAGYDPVEGAKFFARPEAAETSAGQLSFWGTHPPDAVRLATVIEASTAAKAGEELAPKR